MADAKPAETPDPTLGRIVHYTLTDEDVRRLDNDRITTLAYGNLPHAGDSVPAIVVGGMNADAPRTVNLQACLDGNDRLWIANAAEGEEAGQWHYPVKS